MTVYVLVHFKYDIHDAKYKVLGVYATREMAEHDKQAYINSNKGYHYVYEYEIHEETLCT